MNLSTSICHFKRIVFITVYKSQYKNTDVSEDTCYLSYDDIICLHEEGSTSTRLQGVTFRTTAVSIITAVRTLNLVSVTTFEFEEQA